MTEQHKHTNQLINETSPYLLQHAHNPVDWYPWGEEALRKAREENKPILLSIGYSACHWCHVMEHESFENEEIAQLMNENFINIKVDREERPDLDQIYMNAVQMMTGHGGWPMTVFLTPNLVPFYGGTYFPPVDRYNMPGFPRILIGVSQAFRSSPEQVKETAERLLSELNRIGRSQGSGGELTYETLDAAYNGIVRNYDRQNGGFGGAPKFPPSMTLEFLLRAYSESGDIDDLKMVDYTCRRMAQGGIYDQLGGGFHRYSVDAHWLVPHFEKMLYDNALLSRLYLHVYQVTKDDFYRTVVEETLDYVKREMTDGLGGFYSTQDADSEGVEGKFFVWSIEEIEEILGTEDGRLFSAYYGVTEHGNFEEKNILNIARPIEDVARELGIPVDQLEEVIERSRQKLFEVRERRIKPGRDEKILTAWNGLMLSSFAEAAAILERDDYREIARSNAQFILDNLRRDNLLLRTYKDGQAKLNAYLEDYAFMAEALLTLYETTGELRWLKESLSLTDKMIEEFWDEEEGGFFFTGKSHETLIVRNKDLFDNATPSGNSVAIGLLLRLSLITGNEDYQRKAVIILWLIRDAITRYPSAFGQALAALDLYLSRPKEIVIVGQDETNDLAREVWKHYLPNKVVVQADEGDTEAIALIPLLRDRTKINNRPTAYICENYTCQQPVTTVEELHKQLLPQRTATGH
jgi:uncharacterized protein